MEIIHVRKRDKKKTDPECYQKHCISFQPRPPLPKSKKEVKDSEGKKQHKCFRAGKISKGKERAGTYESQKTSSSKGGPGQERTRTCKKGINRLGNIDSRHGMDEWKQREEQDSTKAGGLAVKMPCHEIKRYYRESTEKDRNN